jgi:hypothetical protein
MVRTDGCEKVGVRRPFRIYSGCLPLTVNKDLGASDGNGKMDGPSFSRSRGYLGESEEPCQIRASRKSLDRGQIDD